MFNFIKKADFKSPNQVNPMAKKKTMKEIVDIPGLQKKAVSLNSIYAEADLRIGNVIEKMGTLEFDNIPDD